MSAAVMSLAMIPSDVQTAYASSYVKGVDASWLPAMESSGYMFKNSFGQPEDDISIFKSLGVTALWMSIWVNPSTSNGFSNVAWLINSGYNAVKAVSSSTQVIVHLANGYDTSDFEWFFNGLKAATGHWDIVGMSLYPTSSNYQTYVSETKTTMNEMESLYGTPSMVVEAGFDESDPVDGSAYMNLFSSAVTSAGGLGIFYWEPEAYNWNGYTNGAWNPTTEEPTSVLMSYGPSAVTSGGTYELVNKLSGLALDEPGGQTSNGTKIDQWTVNGGSN